jgi:tetratricopeptide (TPR) repeat protein
MISSCGIWELMKFLLFKQDFERRIEIMRIQGILLCFLLLSAQFGFAQEKATTLEDYFSRARELEKKEDFAGAEKVYLQAAETFPNQPEILKRLAILFQTELKLAESIDAFGKVLKDNPQYPEVNFFLGLSYLGLNQFEKSIEFFNKELEANPKYRRARYYMALAYQSLSRKIDAAQQYDILVKEDPSDSKVWYQLARLYKSLSLQAIKKLTHLDPDSVLVLAMRAESLAEDEKKDEAIHLYQDILKKQPDFAGVHFALGELYWKTLQNEDAERELRLALREDPNHPMANYYLGELMLRQQKPKEALPLLQISVAGDPSLLAGQYQLSKCYLAQGQLQEALGVLLKVVEELPESKMTHYQLAQVYARLRNSEKQKYHLAIFEKLTKEEKEKKVKRSDRLKQMEDLDKQDSAVPSSQLQPPPTGSPATR